MITIPRLLLLGALVVALAGYLATGSPGLADQPMAKRDAELAARAPSELSPAEMLARLERMTQTRPEDPEPHYFIGQFLMSRDRAADAVRAFQSALRRDPNHAPALTGLADAFTRLSGGEIGPEARQLYAEAYGRDRSQLRAGFQVGLSLWQAGREGDARAAWGAIEESLPEGSEALANWRRQVAAATSDAPRGPAAGPADQPAR